MKNGESWDLAAQLAARPEFGMTAEEIRAELEPSRYIGRCPEQVAAMTAACRADAFLSVQDYTDKLLSDYNA